MAEVLVDVSGGQVIVLPHEKWCGGCGDERICRCEIGNRHSFCCDPCREEIDAGRM